MLAGIGESLLHSTGQGVQQDAGKSSDIGERQGLVYVERDFIPGVLRSSDDLLDGIVGIPVFRFPQRAEDVAQIIDRGRGLIANERSL